MNGDQVGAAFGRSTAGTCRHGFAVAVGLLGRKVTSDPWTLLVTQSRSCCSVIGVGRRGTDFSWPVLIAHRYMAAWDTVDHSSCSSLSAPTLLLRLSRSLASVFVSWIHFDSESVQYSTNSRSPFVSLSDDRRARWNR